jgi:hypothetical protein
MGRKGRRTLADGRSGEEQYLKLPYSMAHSLAWRSLSGGAVKIWIELHSRYNGRNNGALSLHYANASKQLGLGRATIRRALDELQTKGFLVLVKQGFWYGHKAAEWRVTDQSYAGNPPSRDWVNWRPVQKSEVGSKAEHINP